MDVKLPDGRVITGVPEGTTKAQIAAKLGLKDVGVGRTVFDQALQGGTFGFADEASDALGAGIASAVEPDLSFGDAYQQARNLSKEQLSAEFDQHPYVSVGSQLAGGLLTGGAGATTKTGQTIGRFLGSGNLPTRLAKSTVASAASGGLYGAGNANDGERAEGAQHGAISGGVVGAAAPLVGAAIGNAVKGSQNAVKGIKARDTDALAEAANQIKSRSSLAYDAMRNNGATFNPQSASSLAGGIESALKADGILNEGLHGKTMSLLNDFKKASMEPDFGVEKLDQWRQLFGQVASNRTPDNLQNARKATLVIEAMDDAVNNLKPQDLATGSREAIEALNKGRAEYSKYSKFSAIKDIIEQSGGDANKLKSNLQKFTNNPKKTRGFTPDEMKALQEAARNSTGEGLLKMAGKFGIDLGSSLSVGNVGLPAVYAAITGAASSAGTGAGVIAGGTAARQAQKWVARGKAEELLRVIENGGQVSTKQLATLPVQDANKLLELQSLQQINKPITLESMKDKR